MLRRRSGMRMTIYGLVTFAALCSATGFYLRSELGSAGEAGTLAARVEVVRFECEVARHQNAQMRHDIEHVRDCIRTVERQTEVERGYTDRLRVSRSGFMRHERMNRAWRTRLTDTAREVARELEGGPHGSDAMADRSDETMREQNRVLAQLDIAIDDAKTRLAKEIRARQRRIEEKIRLRDTLASAYYQIIHILQVAARDTGAFGVWGSAPRMKRVR